MKSKSILFVSHDASRTGAPIIFLNFLRWFKENSDIPFQILLKDGGALESEFEAIAPISIFNIKPPVQRSLSTRILGRLGFQSDPTQSHLNRLKAKLAQDNIGLIYTNTITNGQVLNFLSDFQCPAVCHVHELGYWINHGIKPENLTQVKQFTQHYIAVSKAVQKNLVENQGILEENISIIYESVPIHALMPEEIQQQREKICRQVNLPLDAKIICASGTMDWRKGPDLFIQLARTVLKQSPGQPIYFLWIGGCKDEIQYAQLQYDVHNAGLENQVFFLGEKVKPLEYFAACDIFALMSREDPYPLVCLEAASLGKPILCFDQSGGEPEFVEDDCGFVVPYLDIETMAAKVLTLVNSPELCQRLGENAKQKVEERHSIQMASTQVHQIIRQFLSN
jgi:glycosyltransferase involved in cell wall biosynthesis